MESNFVKLTEKVRQLKIVLNTVTSMDAADSKNTNVNSVT